MEHDASFVDADTLKQPGPIGRLVRFSLGLVCGWFFVFLIMVGPTQIVSQFPDMVGIWFWVIIGLYLFSYVINIGFRKQWGKKPQLVIIALAFVASFIGFMAYNNFWGPPLAWFLIIWLSYSYIHLGISFILSGILATPGCEMRAISHLIAKLNNRSEIVHHCPVGPLSQLDLWEANRQIESGNE